MLTCELYTDEYNAVIPDVGTEENSLNVTNLSRSLRCSEGRPGDSSEEPDMKFVRGLNSLRRELHSKKP